MSVRTGTCSVSDTVIKKFIKPTNSIDGSTLSAIAIDKAPFSVAAAPLQRGRRMRKDGFVIYEPVGASSSTITYKGIRYNLVNGIQICQPTHAAAAGVKWVPERGQPQVAELIATFQRSTADNIAYPDIIITIIPIYSGAAVNSGGAAAFVEQLIRTDASGAAINTLFTGSSSNGSQAPSYAYNICISLTQDRHIDAAVFFFPYGIELTTQSYNAFIGSNTTLPIYGVPGISRAGASTVYNTASGSITSPEGRVNSVAEQIVPSDSKFKTTVQYYLRQPSQAGTRETPSVLTTAQYKCMPFDESIDLVDGNKVLPGEGGRGLDDILAARQVRIGEQLPRPDVKVELTPTETGLIIFSSIIGTAVVLGSAYYIYKKVSQ